MGINTDRLRENPCLEYDKICENTRRKSGRNRARKSASFGHLEAQSHSILFGIVKKSFILFNWNTFLNFSTYLTISNHANIVLNFDVAYGNFMVMVTFLLCKEHESELYTYVVNSVPNKQGTRVWIHMYKVIFSNSCCKEHESEICNVF